MKTVAEQSDFFKQLGGALDEIFIDEFGHRIGFALFLFEFENPARDNAHPEKAANYISNGRREDMIKFLRESADRLENNEDIGAPLGEA